VIVSNRCLSSALTSTHTVWAIQPDSHVGTSL
jgi:hypothetical protein